MRILAAFLALVFVATPAFAAYADELSNAGETPSFLANVSYAGENYTVYGLLYGSSMNAMVIHYPNGSLVLDNSTFGIVSSLYRIQALGSDKDAKNPIETGLNLSKTDLNSFNERLESKTSAISTKIATTNVDVIGYQEMVDLLISEGANYAKSSDMLSELESLLREASDLMSRGMFNSALDILASASTIGPKIEASADASLAIKDAERALEPTLEAIRNASSYDVSEIEAYYYEASSALDSARSSYESGNYASAGLDATAVQEMAVQIQAKVDDLKQQSPLTGWAIRSLTYMPYALGAIAAAALGLFVYKKKTAKITYEYY